MTMTKIGEGTVSPSIGANSYGIFSRVTIRATPAAGWVFDRWEGDMRGKSNPYSFYITGDKTASAIFRPVTATSSNALVRYVGKYDASTSHTKIDVDTHVGWDGYEMSLNSQNWRTTADVDRPLWQHDLTMAVPWFAGDDCIFLINGGSNPLKYPSPDGTIAAVCVFLGVSMAQLDQVPNQPLYFTDEVNNSRTEDEILAYSLDKYLDTGDSEWPVHSAMTKSAVKAMDAIQAEVGRLDDFLVIGASKRGWATWLTTAIDPRVKQIMPLVIDVLNFPNQVEHHWESYGSYSSAIQDYVDFDLFCRVDSDPRADDLLNIVDPYRYISRYTHPKFIVNASGDQFFLPDSSRFYFNQLPNLAQTYLRYMPNKDHYMEGVLDDYNNLLGLLTWGVNAMNGTANPQYSWTINAANQIVVQTSSGPSSVKLWQATNPNARDFRLETVGPIYTSSTLTDQGGGTYIGYCPPPAQGWTAYFVELTFGTQVFTTQIVVTPDFDPYDGLGCWD
jgi:PhoPQ-activated pathogenicity-related protein